MLTSLTLMFASKISLVTYLTYLLVHVSRVNGNLELWFLLRGGPREKLWVQGREHSNKPYLHVMLDLGINPWS